MLMKTTCTFGFVLIFTMKTWPIGIPEKKITEAFEICRYRKMMQPKCMDKTQNVEVLQH